MLKDQTNQDFKDIVSLMGQQVSFIISSKVRVLYRRNQRYCHRYFFKSIWSIFDFCWSWWFFSFIWVAWISAFSLDLILIPFNALNCEILGHFFWTNIPLSKGVVSTLFVFSVFMGCFGVLQSECLWANGRSTLLKSFFSLITFFFCLIIVGFRLCRRKNIIKQGWCCARKDERGAATRPDARALHSPCM